jgi:two-component system CheB/CheR fusion protein
VTGVRDTGIGIRSEMLDRIFDSFQQGAQDEARSTGGLGLGLALAKGLVELHGGTIRARSEGPHKGAELEVRLPLAPAPARAEISTRRPTIPSRRVLIVEDNADAAEMLLALLELDGHEAVIASTGAEALRILRSRGADVVLCDLGLPGMSGYELVRAIRADPAVRAIPVIALTGYGQPDDRRRTAEAGFDDHLTKPVDLQTIAETLARHMR